MMPTIPAALASHAQGLARRMAVLVVALSLIAIPLSGGVGTAEAAPDAPAAEATHEGDCPFGGY